MRTRSLLTVATGVVVCLIVIWLSKTIQGGEKTYEIQPHITIPEYRPDAARAIGAYERLMDRYMGMTERNLIRIEREMGSAIRKLDSIDSKLRDLSARMARIEKAVGTGAAKPPVKKKTQSESPDTKVRKD
ncbi:MAG: hypothetical protein ACYS32_00280 [Planctomycetota bacterium]|jgi:hypothetical protein